MNIMYLVNIIYYEVAVRYHGRKAFKWINEIEVENVERKREKETVCYRTLYATWLKKGKNINLWEFMSVKQIPIIHSSN